MAKIDSDLNVTGSLDPNVRQEWVPLGIRSGYSAVTSLAHTIATTIGRGKYLSPIYQALVDSNQLQLAS